VGNYLVATDYVMADPSRLMAAVISGIGFLGAGTIIQARGNITGLTTAATLWVVAAIGIAVGAGVYVIASGSTFFVLAALIPLGQLEGQFLESPHHWIQATILEDLSIVSELNQQLENRDFQVVNTDISLVEGNTYDVLLEVEGDDEAVLAELTKINEENQQIEEIVIIPSNSSS
jgi:putative Mg2+ transporter-C (MgtC) family protein